MRCHHRNPTSAIQPAGQDPKARPGAGNGHSTAPFADKRQSFLDNVMAGLGQIGAWDDPATSTPAISAQNRATQFGLTPSWSEAFDFDDANVIPKLLHDLITW